ncbi:hypothetical protein N9Z85_05505 [Akkermansiaceae bacterium]|jgi:hypothetical protein|nr:hypothetical protein [Akkermansiaceae bacterium]
MKQSNLIHMAWVVVTISTYVMGSQWARHQKDREAHEMESGLAGEFPGNHKIRLRPPGLTRKTRTKSLLPGSRDRQNSVASVASLTMEELDSLVRSAIKSRGPIEGRRAFDRILQAMQSSSLTTEQVKNIRTSMIESKATGEHLRLFDYAWGASQPEAALAHLDEVSPDQHDAYLANMIPGLASENPTAAIALFHSLEPELQEKIRPRFLEGLVDNDITLATNHLYQSTPPENNDWRPMDTLAREIEKDQGLDTALAWAADLPKGALRSNAWSATYAVWANQDPEAAVKSITEKPQSSDRDQAINGFISAYAHEDGDLATDWAAQITSPTLREGAMIRAGRQYFAQDQEAATQWFASSGLPQSAWAQLTTSNR